MGEKRSRFEIFVAILKVTGSGANMTRIVYGANINFKMAQNYIEYLLDKDFLVLTSENGKKIYSTTEKGRDFVKKYGELEVLAE
ncbi:MAG: transcriptional regulator [Archaeoglobus sp.]|uniref:winged helix-turn-helix domain-containing protein n=1 Tax=Archaeoglobus sp. TaxID=1872626 RepID=UPI001D3E3DDB|nr:winged helix-turn-helix domain-containing protein [Archaeoglobus sp.]MBO8179119.1 transcriptional regulator [Archaeoglobus sp.]